MKTEVMHDGWDKGTLIEIEYLNGAGTAHGFGIGKDNHGNIFKILFEKISI